MSSFKHKSRGLSTIKTALHIFRSVILKNKMNVKWCSKVRNNNKVFWISENKTTNNVKRNKNAVYLLCISLKHGFLCYSHLSIIFLLVGQLSIVLNKRKHIHNNKRVKLCPLNAYLVFGTISCRQGNNRYVFS